MSGFVRRIRGTRPADADQAPPGVGEQQETQPTEQLTVPAGTDLDRLVGDRPATQRRGRLRRRLRHLRSVREILLRDLGGVVFEVHRSGDPAGNEHHGIVGAKLERMQRVDVEIRELETLLDDRRGLVVREPGIGGTCSACGELFGSDARFCWACGTPVAPGAVRPPAAARQIVDQLPALLPVSEAPTTVQPFVEGSSEDIPPPPTAPPVETAAMAPPPGVDGAAPQAEAEGSTPEAEPQPVDGTTPPTEGEGSTPPEPAALAGAVDGAPVPEPPAADPADDKPSRRRRAKGAPRRRSAAKKAIKEVVAERERLVEDPPPPSPDQPTTEINALDGDAGDSLLPPPPPPTPPSSTTR
ncbi:MAG: hypothetical protein QOD86_2887 [Miltoncostaeaceae bacterium]|jgi:hypothetical protein|nr:hypothetical protein [Miltoncostaeaceae bacterium]